MEGEREGEKHQSVASRMHPDQGPNLQLRHVPWPGIKPATSHICGRAPNQLSHTSQGCILDWCSPKPRIVPDALYILSNTWMMSGSFIGLLGGNTVTQLAPLWKYRAGIWHGMSTLAGLKSVPRRLLFTQNLWIIQKQSFCRCHHIVMRSHWIRVDPYPMTGVLTRLRFGHSHTRRPCDDRGRDWGDAAMSQAPPPTTALSEG